MVDINAEPRYSRILQAVASTPWAITMEKWAAIVEVLALRASGVRFTAEEIRERLGAREDDETELSAASGGGSRTVGSVAVIPLRGTLIPRADLLTEASGGTSLERWTMAFRQAVADPGVNAIVIDVDSPGGSVFGVQEAADVVFKSRSSSKPIAAVANTLMASAAYWIGAAADELVVTPSGEVGSIGVFGAHEDLSAALEQAGVKVSLISAGKFKTEGNPFEPLGEEARAAMQARVNDYYGAFVQAVARGRGTSAADVRSGFGEGRVVGAKQAVSLGMADAVGTLEETINRLARGKTLGQRATATVTTTAGETYQAPMTWHFDGTTYEATITMTGQLQPAVEQELAELQAEVAEAVTEAVSSLDLRRRRLRRRALA